MALRNEGWVVNPPNTPWSYPKRVKAGRESSQTRNALLTSINELISPNAEQIAMLQVRPFSLR
jgi:hypothetical protein